MAVPNPLTVLAKTRPYTARRRVIDALTKCQGCITAAGRVLNASRFTVYDVVVRLGLNEFARKLRAERAETGRVLNARRWSLYGDLYAKTPKGKAKRNEKQRRWRARRAAERAAKG